MYPEAVIIGFHYIEDYIKSFNTVEEAIRVSSQVNAIHAAGGFELRNLVSNRIEMVQHFETQPELSSRTNTNLESYGKEEKNLRSIEQTKYWTQRD